MFILCFYLYYKRQCLYVLGWFSIEWEKNKDFWFQRIVANFVPCGLNLLREKFCRSINIFRGRSKPSNMLHTLFEILNVFAFKGWWTFSLFCALLVNFIQKQLLKWRFWCRNKYKTCKSTTGRETEFYLWQVLSKITDKFHLINYAPPSNFGEHKEKMKLMRNF